MDKRRVALGALWLLVVVSAIGLVIGRRTTWGIWEMAVLVIGSGMLVVFVTSYVLRGRKHAALARAGEYAVVAMVVAVVVVLGVAVFAGLASFSPGAVIVAGVFLLVFVGILRDALRALRQRRRDQ